MKPQVIFCGHVANGLGIKISEEKALEMLLEPLIKNVGDVRSYIGSCAWFHNFIPDFASITQPLSKLLRKGTRWEWGKDQIEAINVLRHLITTAPILRYFDPDRKTEAFSDASDYGIGGGYDKNTTMDGIRLLFGHES